MLIFYLLYSFLIFVPVYSAKALEQKQNNLPFCRPFRLDQVIEAASIREELVGKALTNDDWNKKKGLSRVSKSIFDGHNKFVFKVLSESQNLKNLLANCPSVMRLLSVEKVRVFSLKDLVLPAEIKKLGKPLDKVPSDAMIFVGQ